MFREMLKLLTRTGKRDLLMSSVFFALYGLSSIAMIVTVFSILFRIFDGTRLEELYQYFIAIGLLVVFKGICNMVADMKKHSAGFDIVQQIRERMIVKLKKFSLGFYTDERLGEINTILHKDVDNMSLVVGHMWSRMFGDFLIAAVVFIGLASIDIKLALIMAVSVPVALAFLIMTIKKSKKIENKNNSALLDMVSLFVEYVRGIPVLKSFSNNKSLDSDYPIRTYEATKNSYSNNSYSRLIYSSKTMFNDLLKYNFVEHKTNILNPPDLSLLNDFTSDFIRGYFDGNGSIAHTNTEKSNSYAFKLVSTKEFLDFVNAYIKEKLGFSANKYYKRRDYQKVMSLEFGGNLKTQKILDLLYKDANIYLDRKYNRYIDLCNLNNSRALEKSKA